MDRQNNKSSSNEKSEQYKNIRFNILFLTEWYPNKFDPQLGIFIQKHAKGINNFSNINVVYTCADEQLDTTYETIISNKNGFVEITIYYKRDLSLLKSFINPYRYIKANRMGIKQVQKNLGEIDLVHVNILNRPGLIALIIYKLKRIPYIITEHWTGYTSGRFTDYSLIRRWFLRLMIKHARAVTTVSKSLKEKMLEIGLKNNYYIVSNIIESIIPPPPPNNSKVKILTVADLQDSQKNVSGILKAIASIAKQNENIEYHIIGDGPDTAMLFELADSLLINNKFVFFHGRKDNEYVYDFMKQIDFVVINSNFETFSVVATEALVNGKPVIATISGGPEEFITSDYGILIEKGNQLQLEEAILKMISSFKTYDSHKLNKYIVEKFNYTTIGKQFYDIYKPLIKHF